MDSAVLATLGLLPGEESFGYSLMNANSDALLGSRMKGSWVYQPVVPLTSAHS